MIDSIIAERSDWKTLPMPEQHEVFAFKRKFTTQQMDTLRRGNVPKAMEDKWFWYMEGNTLYAHRSWTGICVFILQFDKNSDDILVTVNRDPEQYRSNDIRQDEQEVNMLLNWWCQPKYDYYNEWLSETVRAIQQQDPDAEG